jgi:hypothetical protein
VLSILTPVDPSRKAELEQELSALDASTLSLPRTHMARWVLIDRLDVPDSRRDQPRAETPYLLFSTWFDGPVAEYLPILYKALHGHGIGTTLWQPCGFADTGDACHFAKYLTDYRVKQAIKFSGYDGSTVEEVRRALHLYEQFYDFAVDAQRYDAPRLQKEWRDRKIGGDVGVGP